MVNKETNTHVRAAALIQALPVTLGAVREQTGLSVRAAATEIGVAHTTLRAAEEGKHIRSDCLIKILRWIGQHRKN